MSKPDEVLTIPGFPELSCTNVDAILAILVPDKTSSTCTTIQSLGALCGCPVRDDACVLCRNREKARNQDKELPFLSDILLGSIPTCQTVEAYLKSISKTDSICTASQNLLTKYCGCDGQTMSENDPPCSLCSDGTSIGSNDRKITVPGFPLNTCRQLEDALYVLLNTGSQECTILSQAFSTYCGCRKRSDSCSLCRDGNPVPFPNNTIEWIGNKEDLLGGVTPTCDVMESFIAGYGEEDQQCANARLLGTMCGCAPIADHCTFWPGEYMSEPYLNKSVEELTLVYDFTATCRQAESFLQYQIPGSSRECFFGQHANFLCGCSNGFYSYFGANTTTKQAALSWTPRLSALLSFIGSLLVLWDILSAKRKRNAIYSQIIVGMSCFDILGCVAWGASTLAIPHDGDFGAYIHGARGNDTTCTIQGFLIQLNLTATFYNISLSTYYLLVIVHSWRHDRLKKNSWWMHGIPIALGVSLALGGIPHYRSNVVFCHIQVPPVEPTWYRVAFFSFVPIFAVIFFTTVMMCRVYLKVREQSRRSSAWNFGRFLPPQQTEQNDLPNRKQRRSVIWERLSCTGTRRRAAPSQMARLERDVYVQSLLYLSAFYVSWSFYLAAILRASPSNRKSSSDLDNLYWFYVVCFFMIPLQGFWNAVIYFRHRWVRSLKSCTRSTRSATSKMFSSLQFRRKSQNSEIDLDGSNGPTGYSESDTSNELDSFGRYYDPSTMIAEMRLVVNDTETPARESNTNDKSLLHSGDSSCVENNSVVESITAMHKDTAPTMTESP